MVARTADTLAILASEIHEIAQAAYHVARQASRLREHEVSRRLRVAAMLLDASKHSLRPGPKAPGDGP